MSRFILHRMTKERKHLNCLMLGLACCVAVGVAGYAIHNIGIARAKSREPILIYTEEEFAQYLLDEEGEEYNLNGRYRLEADLELDWLERSIGTNAEPFTGKLDGNGYVINGLSRPLFGVMKEAEIENLFLSGAEIEKPAIYYDGALYVDGYAALAAYAIDSEIRNCGMGGTIQTASPAEAEFLVSKASPAEADERKGPGEEMESSVPEEGSAGAEESESSGQEVGPGMEESGNDVSVEESSDAGHDTDAGPGVETDSQVEESTGETLPVSTEDMEAGSSAEESDTAPSIDTGEGETDPAIHESGESVEETAESVGSQPSTDPADEGTQAGQTEAAQTEAAQTEAAQTEVLPQTQQNEFEPETVGYRANKRDYLMMKVSAVIPQDSPSEATPFDAEDVSGEQQDAGSEVVGDTDNGETESEYIGNPSGDIYILITADRVSVGGLIAQTAGETIIQESFAMVDINSELEDVPTYAGGLAGILDRGTRTENSYVTGTISGDDITGGFAAVNEGIIENCYTSISVGAYGNARGAFIALGSGTLTGCVYDRQMACVDTEDIIPVPDEAAGMEENEAGFHLKGLDTIQMTGEESQVPGNWHTSNQAYPQLEAFSKNEGGAAESYSKASAIALILPEGTTLLDALADSDVFLPTEIDGAEIRWETEGDIGMEEAGISPHEVPVLEQSLVSGEADTGEAAVDLLSAGQPDEEPSETSESTVVEEVPDIKETSKVSAVTFKATISNVTKTFAPVSRLAAGRIFADWNEVGKEVDTAGSEMESWKPEQNADGYYLIGSPEALAWFAYKVNTDNNGYRTAKALVTSNIDLSGLEYAGAGETDVSADYSNCLKWKPIGGLPNNSAPDRGPIYNGTFDGGGHEISNLNVEERAFHSGLFGVVAMAVIKNIKIVSGQVPGTDRVGSICGVVINSNPTLIENCINMATIESSVKATGGVSCNTGGIVGCTLQSGNVTIRKCGNVGNVSAVREAGGIFGGINNGRSVIEDCYNLGTITGADQSGYGGIAGNGGGFISNCYNAGAINAVKNVDAIMGSGTMTITNCYFQKDLAGAVAKSSNAKALDKSQLQSWAAAYALNGQSMDGVWKYTEGEYPVFGVLDRPLDWSVIGQGGVDGLIKAGELTTGTGTAGSPFSIGRGEQLATFAVKVNSGNPENTSLGTAICASLTSSIDLTGANFNGTTAQPIPWIPIGTGETVTVSGTAAEINIYKGRFEGNGKIIANMKVEQEGYGGLFGCAGGGAVIRRLGIDATCSVRTKAPSSGTAGDGTAAFVGAVKSVAGAEPQIVIEHCYNRASVHGKSQKTGAFVGSDEGNSGAGGQRITNCYTTGLLTTEKGGAPGAIAGSFANGVGPNGGLRYCYWDKNTSSAGGTALNAVGQGNVVMSDTEAKATADLKNNVILDKLNAGTASAVWERSDTKNNGYPVFLNISVLNSWEDVGASTQEPSCQSSVSKGTAANPYLIRSPEELAWFAWKVNGGNTKLCGRLMADINLFGGLYTGGNSYDSNDSEILSKALPWIPIGSDSDGKRYEGTFDGNGHTVSHMRVSGSEKLGMFGTVGTTASDVKPEIKNLEITTSMIQASGGYGGGIAGYINGNNVRISLCRNGGEITGNSDYLGGVVGGIGNADSLIIDGCGNRAEGIISSVGGCVGGVVGSLGTGTVTLRNCYNQGTVTGGSNVGGITGYMGQAAQNVENSYNTGTVSGAAASTNGIAGAGIEGGVRNCYYVTGSTADSKAAELTVSQLGSWGAAWNLNGGDFSQPAGISWSFQNSSTYPLPSLEPLSPANDWGVIGQAVEDGLLTGKNRPAGNGSPEQPYQIDNVEQLAWFACKVNTDNTNYMKKCALLNTDIDLAGMMYTKETSVDSSFANCLQWIPIGNVPTDKSVQTTLSYRGTFDGGGHEIKNLYIVGGPFHTGFFGALNDALIKGVRIISGSVTGTDRVGGIGAIANGGVVRFEDCYNGADVKSVLRSGQIACNTGGITGGTLGKEGYAILRRCVNTGKVSGYREVGGIVGCVNEKGFADIEDCYNLGDIIQLGTQHSSSGFGGIVGRSFYGSGTVSNSYNAGNVTGAANVYAIVGNSGSNIKISNCYFQSGLKGAVANNGNTVGLEEPFMKSWSLSYALNKQSMTGPWAYMEGQYPYFGVLTAGNWMQVGEGLEYNLITPSGWTRPGTGADGSKTNPYPISCAEDMAWFAYQINSSPAVNGGLCASLLHDIIDFTGSAYGGTADLPIMWTPIKNYSGTFGGEERAVYELSRLRIGHTANGGLFETVKAGGAISGVGIVDSEIIAGVEGDSPLTGENVGAIAAVLDGGTITRCYGRGNKMNISGSGTMHLGGIAGQVQNGGAVKDCYNYLTASSSVQVMPFSGASSSDGCLGGIAGSISAGGVVQNCYSVCETTTISVGTPSRAIGNITGSVSGSVPAQCYSDGKFSIGGAGSTSDLNGTVRADMKTREVVIGLNTADGIPRVKTDRIWYTSLDREATAGYPTFQPPEAAISVSYNPADAKAEGLIGTLPSTINSLMFRDISLTDENFTPEASGLDGTDLALVSVTDMTGGGYYQYGYEKANKSFAFQAGNADLKSAVVSLHDPKTEIGTVSAIQLYVAAAYTEQRTRYLLLEASSGNVRYEIQITVAGITGKTLSVTMPIEVIMADLEPDKTLKRTTSVPLSIINHNDYPIEGSIVSVTPKETGGYVKLKPIAPNVDFEATAPIKNGVKLGICDSDLDGMTGPIGTADYYYNPDTMSNWLNWRINNKGTLPFRYFIEYQGMYNFEADNQYGYDVTYSFSISKDEYVGDKDAVTW